MSRTVRLVVLMALVLCIGGLMPLAAAPVSWVDWTSGVTGGGGSAEGVLNFDGATVDVHYSGEVAFIQTSGGTNYWNPSSPYISEWVDNAPPASDIIALSKAMPKTLTFSKPVVGLLFAVVSLNGNGYRFNQDFEILSYGRGYWGNGTLTKQDLGDGTYQLNGSGEPHGVIRFTGAVSSITWTSLTNEYWNGFTVGTFGVIIDTTPPQTSISSGPADGSAIAQNTATFTISGTDDISAAGNLLYQWRLDGGAWSEFSSTTSVALSDLAPGTHTFEAAAIDEQDNIDPTPASRTFTVDLAAPVISDVTTAEAQTSSRVTWNTDEPASSVVEYGPTASYGSAVQLDGSLKTAHSVNILNLTPDTVYHYRVRSADGAGNEAVSDDFAFTTLPDAAEPETQITSGPAEGAQACESAVTFGFTGSDDTTQPAQLTYQWRIDGGDWSDFAPDVTRQVTGLSEGSHTFEVAARDAFGKIGPTPAARTFTVDLTPVVLSGVEADPSQLQAAISWITDEESTSQVAYGLTLDLGQVTPLDSGRKIVHNVLVTGLNANTTYYYCVKSTDACGRETMSVVGTFMTSPDAAAPDTSIVSGPGDGASVCDTSATFGFTGSDDTTHVTKLRYSWRVDGGEWSQASTDTTATVTGLAHGPHTFEVAAVDAVDKVDPTPAKRSFKVDMNPPVISAAGGAPSQAQATISWATDEPATSQVDYGESDAYGSSTPVKTQLVTNHSVTLTGLAPDTLYHFRVRSQDSCGRESVSDDATVTTAVDDGSPETLVKSGPAEGGAACSTTVQLCWGGSDSATPEKDLVYSWRLDDAGWSDYTSETCRTFTDLAEGSHVFYVRAKDPSGNVDPTPGLRHFTVDLSSPEVTDVKAVGQSVEAVVTWQTTKPATSVVEYGETADYGRSTPAGTQRVTSHAVTVRGLSPETTYHFRVRSKDVCDNEAVSGDGTFTTTADADAPNTVITSGPAEGGKSCETDVRICWTGSDNATPTSEMLYQYKLDTQDWTAWSPDTCADFAGLADGVHTLSVQAKDSVGNVDGTPAVRTFIVDTTTPTMSNVFLSPRQSSVTVSWITSEPATSQVEYGPTSAYGSQTRIDSNKVTSHKLTISGLTSETTYHFRVKSDDGCLEAVSDDHSVATTAIIPPNLQPISLQTPLSTSSQQEMQVTWTVKNTEPGDATTGWLDALYLSDDEVLDELDTPLGMFTRGSGLSGMFAYNIAQNLTMPMTAPGLHYLILKVDVNDVVAEIDETDNTFVQAINFTMPKQLVLTPGQLWLKLHPGTPVSGQIDVSNMGITSLSGLAAAVADTSANIDVQIDVPGAIDALNAGKINYTVTASDESVLQNTPVLHITTTEGPDAEVVLNLLVIPRQPKLVAVPGRLDAGMVRGKQATVECEIVNNGGVPAEGLEVTVPDVPWLGLVSPRQIGTLAPGESTTVSLLLKPSSTLELGPYSGNFAVAGSNGGVSVPFRFNAISDGRGSIRVTAVDEFTFFADDKPNVTDATVKLTDAVDGSVIFEAMTDMNGVVLREDIPEGHYNLEVSAYKHSTTHQPVEIVAGETQEIQAFMRRQMVSYTWNVEPVQIEDKYRVSLEAVFETHVPAPVVTVDPPFRLIPVLEGLTTEVDYTITNHGLIAAQGVQIDFGESADFYIVPLIKDIGTLAPMSSIVVPVLVRAKSDGPIPDLPQVSQGTPAAVMMAASESAQPDGLRVMANGDDASKPCDLTIQGKVLYYYKCVDNVPVAVPIDTTPIKIGKDIYDIIKCGLDLAACAGGMASSGAGGAAIAADKCPDAVRCLFKYTCEIISANMGTPCCFCKLVSSLLGDTGAMGDALGCLPKPNLSNSQPVNIGDGGGWGGGLNLPSNGFAVDVTPWDFGTGVPGDCAGTPPVGMASKSAGNSITSNAAAPEGASDISRYGGKEVRYQTRCY